jgi:hypothetical protein
MAQMVRSGDLIHFVHDFPLSCFTTFTTAAIKGAALYAMAPMHDKSSVLSAIQGAALYVMRPTCTIPGGETASVTYVFWTSWKSSVAVYNG